MGIIPAYAGTTSTRPCRPALSGDHPRLRGDHVMVQTISVTSSGSSPPTRVPRRQVVRVGRLEGIIPAYAGTTIHWLANAINDWDHPRLRGDHPRRRPMAEAPPDHPRLRGDHVMLRSFLSVYTGSSPPTRGPQFSTCYLTIRLAVFASLCRNNPTARRNNLLSMVCITALRTTYPNFRLLCRLLALLQPF